MRDLQLLEGIKSQLVYELSNESNVLQKQNIDKTPEKDESFSLELYDPRGGVKLGRVRGITSRL
jgi:hypothetical protein